VEASAVRINPVGRSEVKLTGFRCESCAGSLGRTAGLSSGRSRVFPFLLVHNARHAHLKDSGHRPTSFATRNQSDNAFTPIETIRSRRPCRLPATSTEFESDASRFGNPQRFNQTQEDASGLLPADPETGEIATASFKPHPPCRRNPGHLRPGGRGASSSSPRPPTGLVFRRPAGRFLLRR
jgi:hypothetical protein